MKVRKLIAPTLILGTLLSASAFGKAMDIAPSQFKVKQSRNFRTIASSTEVNKIIEINKKMLKWEKAIDSSKVEVERLEDISSEITKIEKELSEVEPTDTAKKEEIEKKLAKANSDKENKTSLIEAQEKKQDKNKDLIKSKKDDLKYYVKEYKDELKDLKKDIEISKYNGLEAKLKKRIKLVSSEDDRDKVLESIEEHIEDIDKNLDEVKDFKFLDSSERSVTLERLLKDSIIKNTTEEKLEEDLKKLIKKLERLSDKVDDLDEDDLEDNVENVKSYCANKRARSSVIKSVAPLQHNTTDILQQLLAQQNQGLVGMNNHLLAPQNGSMSYTLQMLSQNLNRMNTMFQGMQNLWGGYGMSNNIEGNQYIINGQRFNGQQANPMMQQMGLPQLPQTQVQSQQQPTFSFAPNGQQPQQNLAMNTAAPQAQQQVVNPNMGNQIAPSVQPSAVNANWNNITPIN